MKIKQILISQPTPALIEKSPFYEVMKTHQLDLHFQPFMKVEGVSLKEFRSQRIEILDHSAIIFTSRSIIDSFFHICEEARITVPETMKYVCNSEAVALYLQKYIIFRKRKIFFADGSFSKFMDLIVKHKNEKFLLTLSDPHKPELVLGLEKLKLNFHEVILTHSVPSDLSTAGVSQHDMLVCYSPTEIASLVSQFPDRTQIPPLATFGHGTTKAALCEGLTVNVIAPSPEAPSMAKALEIYLKQLSEGKEVAPIVLEQESPDQAYIQAQASKRTRGCGSKSTAKAKSTASKTCASKSSAKAKSTPAKSETATKSSATKSSTAPKKSVAKAAPKKSATAKSSTTKSAAAKSTKSAVKK